MLTTTPLTPAQLADLIGEHTTLGPYWAQQIRTLLANLDYQSSISDDRGDTSPTLVTLVDKVTQRFATTLTAARVVTLSGTNAYRGARFRVVRTGLGAFTLDVGGLKVIPSATAAFVDVMHDGAAWRLTGYGAL